MLGHVLWIGGPPGTGKSAVALRMARRYGLRWYNSDAYSWDHRERAVRAGVPAAIRFESMSRERRRALPVAEQLAMTLQRERGPMTIDDLCALPSSPLIVAEGTQITPRMLPAGSRALFLMASPEVQRARLELRHGPSKAPELYLGMRRQIEEEVYEADAPRLVVDGLTVDETVAEVEEFFGDMLARGPTATTAGERRALLRFANRVEVERYRAFCARPWNDADFGSVVHSFACECGDPECDALVELAVAGFPPEDSAPPVLARGHLQA